MTIRIGGLTMRPVSELICDLEYWKGEARIETHERIRWQARAQKAEHELKRLKANKLSGTVYARMQRAVEAILREEFPDGHD